MGIRVVKPIQKRRKLGKVNTIQRVKALKSGTGLKTISSLRRGPSII